MLQVERTRVGEVEGLKVRGEVDHENADVLGRSLLDLIMRGHAQLVIDLRDVDYVDGAGISVLLMATELLPPGGRIGLLNPSPNVQRMLELSDLGSGPRCHIISDAGDRGNTGSGGVGEQRPPLGSASRSSP